VERLKIEYVKGLPEQTDHKAYVA